MKISKLISIGICLGLFSLCGNNLFATNPSIEEILPESNARIKVWANDPGEKELYEIGIKKFQEKYKNFNVEIKHENIGILDSFRLLVQDGGTIKVGDVVSLTHDVLGKAVVSGIIMENLVSGDNLNNNFLSNAVKAATAPDGYVYGFPYSFETLLLYYNKDLINKPQSFEEIISFAKEFNNPSEYKYALAWGITDYYQTRAFLAMDGGYEFGNDGKNPKDLGIASDNFIKGMTSLLKLKETTTDNTSDISNTQVAEGLFLEGLVASIISGPWSANRLMKDSDLNVGVVSIPTFDGKNPTPFSTVKMLVVSSFTEYPKAAQLFAEFMSSEDMLLERFKLTGQAPVHKNIINRQEVQLNEIVSNLLQQEKNSYPMPSIAEMGYIWEPMNAAISEVWDNNKNPEEVLKHAEKVIKDQINIQ